MHEYPRLQYGRHEDEGRKYGPFFNIVRNRINERLAQGKIKIDGLRIFSVASQVNFLFEGMMRQREIILKCNYFGRSILHSYEKFLEIGEDKFAEELKKYDTGVQNSDGMREEEAFANLKDAGVRVPDILASVFPDITIMEKINGTTLDENLGKQDLADELARNIARIHSSDAACKHQSHLHVSKGGYRIEDPNFNEPLAMSNAPRRILDIITEVQAEAKQLLHGDLKGNNILVDESGLAFIDPKMHRGYAYSDLGKFIMRTYVNGLHKKRLSEAHSFVARTVEKYRGYATREPIDLEERSIIFGMLELNKIIHAPRRVNIELLGSEMQVIFAFRKKIGTLIDSVLAQGEKIDLNCLFAHS